MTPDANAHRPHVWPPPAAQSGYGGRVTSRTSSAPARCLAPVGPLAVAAPAEPVLLRRVIGARLRGLRLAQGRTLREVSGEARVSLGYLSEVERGQKEASSELLGSICGALDVPLSELMRQVADGVAEAEGITAPAVASVVEAA